MRRRPGQRWRRFPGWKDVTAEEWRSAQWQRSHCVKNTAQLRGVHGTSASDVWAVGDGGALLRFDGAAWTAMTSGTSNALSRVFALTPSRAYAVGQAGIVLAFDGARWTTVQSGAATFLFGVWSTGGHTFAVGGDGAILEHRD